MESGNSNKVRVLRIATLTDDVVVDQLHQSSPASVSVGRGLGARIKLHDAWELPLDRRRLSWLWFLIGVFVFGAGCWLFGTQVESARRAAEALDSDPSSATLSTYFASERLSGGLSRAAWGIVLVFSGLVPLVAGYVGLRTPALPERLRRVADPRAPRAPDRHLLFVYRPRQGYELDIPRGIAGKVSIGSKVATLSQLRKKFPASSDGTIRVRLGQRAKGKLLLGETTLLFQLTAPQPAEPKLRFPVQLRDPLHFMRMSWLAWATHLASLALLGIPVYYVGFVAEPVAPEADERYVNIMDLDKIRLAPDEPDEPPKEPEKPKPKPKPKEEPKEDSTQDPREPDQPPPKKKFSKEAVAKAKKVGVARALANFGVTDDVTIVDALSVGVNKHTDFVEGMTTRASGLVVAGSGDVIVGGEGIDEHGEVLGNTGLATATGPAGVGGAKKRERKVKSRVRARDTEVFGDVDSKRIKAFIRRRTGALLHCYEKVLRVKPNLEGKVAYEITVSVRGRVTDVRINRDTLREPSVLECTKAKIRGWRFPSDKDAKEPADVNFSVIFSR